MHLDEIAIGKVNAILIVIAVVIVASMGAVYLNFFGERVDDEEKEELEPLVWSVDLVTDGPYYELRIGNITKTKLKDVSVQLIDGNGSIAEIADPDPELGMIVFDVSVFLINFSDQDAGDGHIDVHDWFYSQDPGMQDKEWITRNHTLYIAFSDEDLDGMIGRDDFFVIRSPIQGGLDIDENWTFRLNHDERDEPFGEASFPEPPVLVEIAWNVSVSGDDYFILIIEIISEDLENVSWSLLNLNRLITTWDDPDAETIRLMGDLDEINWTQSDYDAADIQINNKFFSRDPIDDESTNHTLAIVIIDVDSSGKLSNGDAIWIRSYDNDGPAEEGFRFRLVNERENQAYGELILPEV